MNDILRELRRETFSVKNRLQSIIYDSRFVSDVSKRSELHQYPVVPNERCGSWYVPSYEEAVYFKSTDSHTNEWTFSTRRLNMQLLSILASFDGVVVVDATRKGKLLPDALSKTVPIWCAVINYIMYEGSSMEDILCELELTEDDAAFITALKSDNWVRTPKHSISRNEHNQIVKRIPLFVKEVSKLGLFTKESLVKELGARKPIICSWYYPNCKKLTSEESFYFESDDLVRKSYYTVACLSASRSSETKIFTEGISFEYIQGAGDDHELWATKEVALGKLDSKFFWKYIYTNTEIIDQNGYIFDSMSEAVLLDKLNMAAKAMGISNDSIHTKVDASKISSTGISFGTIASDLKYTDFIAAYPEVRNLVVFSSKYIVAGQPEVVEDHELDSNRLEIFHFKIDTSKKGAKLLRQVYPELIPKLSVGQVMSPVMILCETGDDISVGTVVILLCKHFDTAWKPTECNNFSKDTIKKHLSLLQYVRKVNPSRNTLQSVNSYLMS